MTDDLDCDQCRATWKIYGEDPPCEECEPAILPENALPFRVFCMVCDQHIMGQNGPMALNMQPVFRVLDEIGVKDKLNVMAKIKKAYAKAMEAKRGK